MTEMDTEPFRIEWHTSMATVDRTAWDRLAAPLDTPFLEWAWLNRLETSGSIAPDTGWYPVHLTVLKGPRMVAAAPLYVKTHSRGEFVFDHIWADVARRIDTTYYPKLIGTVPVTPLAGYRFLMDPTEAGRPLTALMLGSIYRLCEENGLASVNFHFTDTAWRREMTAFGLGAWIHQRFVWINPGYDSFDDYLARLKTNQRRNIHRERAAMEKNGLRLSVVPGPDFDRRHLARMYDYYSRTNDKFGLWGCKYLSPGFFDGLLEDFGHRLLFVIAANGSSTTPIGLSMLVAKGKRLYGRYWGSAEEIRFLHFNACYYVPIDWAIAHGVRYYDPGMGGEHKARRGFVSTGTFSLHHFFDERLDTVFRHAIGEVNRLEAEQIRELNRTIPFAETTGKTHRRR